MDAHDSMVPPPDLILRDGTLADGSHVDIAIRDGHIAGIAPHIAPSGVPMEQLDGQLVLPAFVDLHMHLDKALTMDLTENSSGTLLEAIVRYGELAPRFTRESFVERALRTLRLCAASGTTAVRTHINVGAAPGRGLLALEALLEVREQVRDMMDVQTRAPT